MVKGFSCKLGYYSVIGKEAWGVYYGLDLAWNMGGRKLILEVDSIEVVSAIEKGFNDTSEVSNVFHNIALLIQRD